MAAHGGPRRGATGGGEIISRGARVLTTRCASLFTQSTDDLTTYGSLCTGPSGTAHIASQGRLVARAPAAVVAMRPAPLSRLSTVVVDNIDMTKLLPVTLT